MALPPKYEQEYKQRIERFELKNQPKHSAGLYAIFFTVGGTLLVGFTLAMNGMHNDWQAPITGLAIGGAAYFIQNQNHKNYRQKLLLEMKEVEKELMNKAALEGSK